MNADQALPGYPALVAFHAAGVVGQNVSLFRRMLESRLKTVAENVKSFQKNTEPTLCCGS